MKTNAANNSDEQGNTTNNNLIDFPFSFDPKPIGIKRHIKDYNNYNAHSIPTCENRPTEPEVKWIIPDYYSLDIYTKIYESFSKSPFAKDNMSSTGNSDEIEFPVFLADNRINAREALLSIALDTPDYKVMREAGEQVRSRGPFKHEHAHDNDPLKTFPRGQCTIKDLFSKCAQDEDRVELESKSPTRKIQDAAPQYIKANIDRLHPVYQDLDTDELRVSGICYTPRASFHIIVHLPEHKAFIEYEACADPNTFFTPHGDIIAGTDNELEYEAKKIYIHQDEDVDDERLIAIYEASKKSLSHHILEHFGDFELAQFSKVERTVRAVGQYYHDNMKSYNIHSSQVAFNTNSSLENFPYREKEIEAGMVHAMRQNVHTEDVVANRTKLAPLVSRLVTPSDIIVSKGVEIMTDADTGIGQMPEQKIAVPAMR